MIFTETHLKDVFVIEPEKIEDNRGFFSRVWDENIFKKNDLETKWVQSSISYNLSKGTLRGMHFQKPPYEETKMIRCTKGRIFDVIVDLRKDSPTFKKWISVELNDENRKILYIPKGFAHGFQTLVDNTEIFYQISEYHHSDLAHGIIWNDPELSIDWPLEITLISNRDANLPYLKTV